MKEITLFFSVWFTQNILSVKGIYARILDSAILCIFIMLLKANIARTSQKCIGHTNDPE